MLFPCEGRSAEGRCIVSDCKWGQVDLNSHNFSDSFAIAVDQLPSQVRFKANLTPLRPNFEVIMSHETSHGDHFMPLYDSHPPSKWNESPAITGEKKAVYHRRGPLTVPYRHRSQSDAITIQGGWHAGAFVLVDTWIFYGLLWIILDCSELWSSKPLTINPN